jgi:hypothetical protein
MNGSYADYRFAIQVESFGIYSACTLLIFAPVQPMVAGPQFQVVDVNKIMSNFKVPLNECHVTRSAGEAVDS